MGKYDKEKFLKISNDFQSLIPKIENYDEQMEKDIVFDVINEYKKLNKSSVE